MTMEIVPLTSGHWDRFADLFGPQGACYGCWCTYFRLPPKEREANDREANKAHMRARVMAGPPPGILAVENDQAIGWLQVGPKADVPQWNSKRRVSAPQPDSQPEDGSVWAMSCFFVAKNARGKSVSRRLVAGGVEFARKNGARLIESCPMDSSKSPLSLFVGSSHVFREAGFEQVALRKEGRPLMRLVL